MTDQEIVERLKRMFTREPQVDRIEYSDAFASRVIRDALLRLGRPVSTADLDAELRREMAGEGVWPWRVSGEKCVPPVPMLEQFGARAYGTWTFDGDVWSA